MSWQGTASLKMLNLEGARLNKWRGRDHIHKDCVSSTSTTDVKAEAKVSVLCKKIYEINCNVAIKKNKKNKEYTMLVSCIIGVYSRDMLPLCQAFISMTYLTLFNLSNELDSNCQRHLVTSLEEMSWQRTVSIKMLNLEGACLKMTRKGSN